MLPSPELDSQASLAQLSQQALDKVLRGRAGAVRAVVASEPLDVEAGKVRRKSVVEDFEQVLSYLSVRQAAVK